jgi:hypothetical protein
MQYREMRSFEEVEMVRNNNIARVRAEPLSPGAVRDAPAPLRMTLLDYLITGARLVSLRNRRNSAGSGWGASNRLRCCGCSAGAGGRRRVHPCDGGDGGSLRLRQLDPAVARLQRRWMLVVRMRWRVAVVRLWVSERRRRLDATRLLEL